MAKTTLDEVLADLQLYTDERDYSIVQLPARAITLAAGIVAEVADPFAVLIVDKDEVTLVLASELIPEFDRRIPAGTPTLSHYRLITFDVALDAGLTGFMAVISQSLADAGIPIMAFAAFSRDHLLIRSEDVSKAVSVLENLRAGR